MDYKTLARNLGLEENEYLEMITLFVEVSNSDLDRWEAGLQQSDAEKVRESAHSIKGAAVNLGLQEIGDTAFKVEVNAREKNLTGAPEAASKIRKMLDQLADEIKSK
ncbi:MAG: Hpt domain-containing protein, partial [Deltaproteobacteria bacterium]|nr:Hpt domain-containing protein [Deltaproteobacteria bacterium]